MKATLSFDCDIPEEQEALDICLRAGDAISGLHDFREALRAIYKYEEHSDEVDAMVERIRGLLVDHLGEHL